MTCKDCIHYEACKDKFAGLYKICVDEPEKHLELNSNVENVCSHFKDKSRFVELPCKVGDVVYLVSMQKITVDVATRIKYLDMQNLMGKKRISIGGEKFSIYDDDFGRIAFTDKRKAEARLKELNK